MSANEIQNLLVRIEPEGVDDTTQSLEDQSQQFEETADTVGEESGRLEDFSQRWSGAMNAIVAGLAIGAAGLLTQVPVIGEALGGLSAIIDALAFQIDHALRPALGDLTRDLFNLSEQMFAAEGPLQALDMLAEKIGEIGAASIRIAIGQDVVQAAVDDLVELVFPKISEGDVLDHVFAFNLSGASVVAALFGGFSITASRVLTWVLPFSISTASILGFMLPIIGGSVLLSHIFDVNMTTTAILSTIFAGVVLTAALIMGATFGPVVITGAAIIGTLFAGVVITEKMILEEIFGLNDTPVLPQGDRSTVGPARGRGREPAVPLDPSTIQITPEMIRNRGANGQQSNDGGINLDGRQVTEDTGRYRVGQTTRRGRGP